MLLENNVWRNERECDSNSYTDSNTFKQSNKYFEIYHFHFIHFLIYNGKATWVNGWAHSFDGTANVSLSTFPHAGTLHSNYNFLSIIQFSWAAFECWRRCQHVERKITSKVNRSESKSFKFSLNSFSVFTNGFNSSPATHAHLLNTHSFHSLWTIWMVSARRPSTTKKKHTNSQ